ncbi:MAG: hypothetical protein ACKOC9_11355 [Alphaproteobacteria bacterium]
MMKLKHLLRDRRIWLALGAVAILIMLRSTGLSDQLSLATLARHREALAAFVGANLLLAAGAYVLLYVVAVAQQVLEFHGAFPVTATSAAAAQPGAACAR